MVQTHRPAEPDAAAPARHEAGHGEGPGPALRPGCGPGSWQACPLLEMLLSLNELGICMHVIMVHFVIIMTDSFLPPVSYSQFHRIGLSKFLAFYL